MGAVDSAGHRGAGAAAIEAMRDALRRALSCAAVYRVLAAAFAYPQPGHAAAVARAAGAALRRAPATMRPALAELARTSDGLDDDVLAEQYVTLFDGQVACSPYEGAYGLPQMSGKVMQLADIAGFYAAFGMTASGRQPDADDHIGAELEFMSALSLKEAWARAQQDAEGAAIARDAQRAFFDEHLGRWGDAFAARVLNAAPAGLYAPAARLLSAWLRAECERLAVSPVPLEAHVASDEGALTCPMADEEGRK
jgi:DMSO reductase family type II enzyme chaperone